MGFLSQFLVTWFSQAKSEQIMLIWHIIWQLLLRPYINFNFLTSLHWDLEKSILKALAAKEEIQSTEWGKWLAEHVYPVSQAVNCLLYQLKLLFQVQRKAFLISVQ